MEELFFSNPSVWLEKQAALMEQSTHVVLFEPLAQALEESLKGLELKRTATVGHADVFDERSGPSLVVFRRGNWCA
jgi:hypothetical protein